MISSILAVLILLAPFSNCFTEGNVYNVPKEAQVSSTGYSTYRHWLTVSPDGRRVVYIDTEAKEVRALNLESSTTSAVAQHTDHAESVWGTTAGRGDTVYFSGDISKVARQGQRPNEVNIPIAVGYDRSGTLFISDVGNRRVSLFSLEGSFENSFLLPTAIGAPSDLRIIPDGNYLLANLYLDSARGLNSGYHCNVVSPSGKLLRSFAYTPKTAFDRNLWLGVYSVFDLDEDGNVYVAFTIEPVVYVYNTAGELLRTFGETPKWWVSPPHLQVPRFRISNEPDGFYTSWTRVVRLLYVSGGKLLRCTETNGLIKGCSQPYVLDVFSTDGRLVAGGIQSEYLPISADSNGMIYFVSVNGDRLIRTSLRDLGAK
jgi:hypothetical protein